MWQENSAEISRKYAGWCDKKTPYCTDCYDTVLVRDLPDRKTGNKNLDALPGKWVHLSECPQKGHMWDNQTNWDKTRRGSFLLPLLAPASNIGSVQLTAARRIPTFTL